MNWFVKVIIFLVIATLLSKITLFEEEIDRLESRICNLENKVQPKENDDN